MDQGLIIKDDISDGLTDDGAVLEKITVGQRLREARTARDVTDIEKISAELCIRPHLLRALEQNDFKKFPSACYAAGFLKNYAAFLGLDVKKVVAQYKAEYNGSSEKVELSFIEVDKQHNYAQHLTVSLVIISLAILYSVWHSQSGGNLISLSALPDVNEITSNILVSALEEDQPANHKADQKINQQQDQLLLPEKAVIEKKQGFNLVQQARALPLENMTRTSAVIAEQMRLTVSEDTWVRVVGAGKDILVDRILLAGEEFYLSGRDDMTLMTSNAGAVSLYVGDYAVAPLGKSGEVRSNISLKKSDLIIKTAERDL